MTAGAKVKPIHRVIKKQLFTKRHKKRVNERNSYYILDNI